MNFDKVQREPATATAMMADGVGLAADADVAVSAVTQQMAPGSPPGGERSPEWAQPPGRALGKRGRRRPVFRRYRGTVVSHLEQDHLAAAVTYPRPREGRQWAPPNGHVVLAPEGNGPKIGVRAAVVSLAAVVVLAAIGYGVYATTQTPPLTNLSAQVVSTGQVALGFPQPGVLSKVFIHPGEHVAAGQTLATEVVAGLNQQVTADGEAVNTDQSDIAMLTALLKQATQQAASSASNQQQIAQTGVSSAASAIASTQSARQAAITAYQAEVTAASQTLQTDESDYAKACGSSPTGGSSCESLAHFVAADKQSLSSAEADLSAQQAAQADWAAEASRLLADQRAAQTGLTGDTTLALAPLEVDLANARSQLRKDQAQLATDQAKGAEESLQAPQTGTVVSVDGAPGEVVSGTGVSGGTATGGSVSVTPRVELFPSQQVSAVAVLAVGGPLLVNVVVPESQIGLVHTGAAVTIKPGVAGPRPIPGVVTEIFPTSIVAAGVVSYEVQVKAGSGAGQSGWLPGMTATATISR
jgi:multidrug efflux pump subunit AcrA (membrane-fusion protein)